VGVAPPPDWNIWVKAPGAGLAEAGGGHSPSGWEAGKGELNRRANSLAWAESAEAAGFGVGGGAWNRRVNSPGCEDAAGRTGGRVGTCGGDGWNNRENSPDPEPAGG
jgi:hypothetical protein